MLGGRTKAQSRPTMIPAKAAIVPAIGVARRHAVPTTKRIAETPMKTAISASSGAGPPSRAAQRGWGRGRQAAGREGGGDAQAERARPAGAPRRRGGGAGGGAGGRRGGPGGAGRRGGGAARPRQAAARGGVEAGGR